MAKSIPQIVIATDTFAGWVSKTNLIIDTIANEAVTVNSTTNGANTTGNGSVIGILTANTLGANLLRGGGIGNTANLNSLTIGFSNSTVSSNVTVTGYTSNVTSNNLNVTSNTVIGSGTQRLTANVANVSITTNTFSISSSSNVDIASSVVITGDATVNNYLTFNNKATIDVSTITLAFPNTTQQNTVNYFSLSDYTGAQYTVSVTDENNSNNRALTQISVIYGFGNSHMTEYGTIYSNTQFMTFSVTSNSSHVILNANSATSNATFKVYRTTFV